MPLNIFIGWSGKKSFVVAKEMAVWLKKVIPNIETWLSEQLSPGTVAWFNDLNERLRQADFAVICVNPDNWNSPWLSYEPGVVVGREGTRVCPYLIDPYALRRNLPEPLKLFWAERCSEEGTYNLVKIIHEAANGPLSDEAERQFKGVFKEKWPELWKVIKGVAGPRPSPPPPGPAQCIHDFTRVSQMVEQHQDRLRSEFYGVIRKAVRDIREDTYDSAAIIELAVSEIRRSKERFRGKNSLLVGDVCAFFESHYTEDDLRRAVAEMESSLVSAQTRRRSQPRPPTSKELDPLREGWETYMEIAVAKVFSEYHRILLGKLNDCLAGIESRTKGGS